jgi:hypothetical protein
MVLAADIKIDLALFMVYANILSLKLNNDYNSSNLKMNQFE